MKTNDRTNELNLNDFRFDQLMDLAREGNEEAISDLWHEYGYDYESAALQDDYYDDVDRVLEACCGVGSVDSVDEVDLVEVGGAA